MLMDGINSNQIYVTSSGIHIIATFASDISINTASGIATYNSYEIANKNWAAAAGHNHSGVYAPASHTHDDRYFTETECNSNFATAGHNHSGVYSIVGHDHSGVYSVVSHNHSGVYSVVDHNHSGVYAPASHTHDDRYYTETEIQSREDDVLNVAYGYTDGVMASHILEYH